MAKGYWIGRVDVDDVDDVDEYLKYVAANAKPFAAYGARLLIRGGSFDELIKLVRTHPGASEAHRLAALEAELKLYPSMKDEILRREAEERAAWP